MYRLVPANPSLEFSCYLSILELVSLSKPQKTKLTHPPTPETSSQMHTAVSRAGGWELWLF